MGWGDDVIARADAYHLWLESGQPQQIRVDLRPQKFSELWQGSWWIDQENGEPLDHRLESLRPYARTPDYRLRRAPPTWLPEELYQLQVYRSEEPYWLICPDVKKGQHYKNKDWGWRQWQQLVGLLKTDRRLVRPRPPWSDRELEYCENVQTESVRDLWLRIEAAELVVTSEGLSHHLRAQSGGPAVVIYGSATSPRPSRENQHSGTGYPEQLWIEATGQHQQCYPRDDCPDCETAWCEITPELVRDRALRYMAYTG